MVTRSARVRGRSAKSEVGVVCQQQEMVARVYALRAARGVFVTCLLFRACGRGGISSSARVLWFVSLALAVTEE